MKTESPYPMITVEAALAIVLAHTEPLPAQSVKLAAALGLVLAEAVVTQTALPPFPASTKDGYAVIAADGPGEYPVVGEVTAGQMAEFTVAPGTVAYITTGAPLPAGADAVVMVEETEPLTAGTGERRVLIRTRVKAGDDVRPIGSDLALGQPLLAADERLGAAEIGLLATAGAVQVAVYPQPRVAILSTGDELVEPGLPLGPGQIYDSNRAMLVAAVRTAGGLPVDLGMAQDSPAHLMEQIQHGLQMADVLLTSGGVSMGERDLIQPLLGKIGRVHFGRIRMKPGKPLTFATVQGVDGEKLIFGLPGNPVSSLVTFTLLVVPALRKLAGWSQPNQRRVQAHLAQPLPLDSSRPEYHRATLRWTSELNRGNGGFLATSTGNQASSRLLSARSANALLELPQGEGELAAGAVVTALLLHE